MISIQSAMLVALGFLAAIFCALLLAPAFWKRAVRLTTQRLKDAMPLTEHEIQADKDRLRAEYAITVHRLERNLEQTRLAGNRQRVELNRRDARINEIEGDLETLRGKYEEAENARRVLEQTITERLPRVEGRLGEARHLISARDQELGELVQTAERQRRALAEAAGVNAQQHSEIKRLETALATRGSRKRQGPADERHDGEVALRAELEALRNRAREQAQMISSLQGRIARGADGEERPANGLEPGQSAQIAKLVASTPNGAKPPSPPVDAGSEARLRALQTQAEDQATEIARLQAALAVYQRAQDDARTDQALESRISLKARLTASEAENTRLTETIQKLRGDLAAGNERAARQAAHFADEMKKLGAGTLPAATRPRPPVESAQKLSLAERVARARIDAEQRATAIGNQLAATRPSLAAPARSDRPHDDAATPPATQVVRPAGHAEPDSRDKVATNGAEGSGNGAGPAKPAATDTQAATVADPPRLLDRISGAGRGS